MTASMLIAINKDNTLYYQSSQIAASFCKHEIKLRADDNVISEIILYFSYYFDFNGLTMQNINV